MKVQADKGEKRSFSRLLTLAVSGVCGFVSSVPESPASQHTDSAQSSLQGGFRALQWAEFSTGDALHCPICHSGHSDPARLARVLGTLPIGAKVVLPVVAKILGEKFSLVNQDLVFLKIQLKAQIKFNSHGIRLLAPVEVCKQCAQIGAQLRQTYPFQKHFRAALLGAAGQAVFRVLPESGQGEPSETSPNSG